MNDTPKDPFRAVDDDARTLAKELIAHARFAALGVMDPETQTPMVSRIAIVPDANGAPLGLISDLSHHTQALLQSPKASLLVGEPGQKGDPLTFPRITLQVTAAFVRHGHPEHAALAAHFVKLQPKVKLYIGFADFSLVRFAVTRAFLNGGFGKAYRMTAQDIA